MPVKEPSASGPTHTALLHDCAPPPTALYKAGVAALCQGHALAKLPTLAMCMAL